MKPQLRAVLMAAVILVTGGVRVARADGVANIPGAGVIYNTANHAYIYYQELKKVCVTTPFRWNGHPVEFGLFGGSGCSGIEQ